MFRGSEPAGPRRRFGPAVSPGRRVELVAEVTAQSTAADELWNYLQKWLAARSAPIEKSASKPSADGHWIKAATEKATREDELDIRICIASRQFFEKFPEDPRRSEARLFIVEKHGWEDISQEEMRLLLQQIVAALDAPAPVHARARYLQLCDALNKNWSHHEVMEEAATSYERDYPDDKVGERLVLDRLLYYSETDPEKILPLLQQWTASPNKATAAAAESALELRTKPLQLKFPTTDGKVFDVEKYRGRLVLLYFWASGGEPTKSLLPQIKALKSEYSASNLQVLGINVDQERSDMRKSIKERRMDWPNGNDMAPEKGRAVSDRFAVPLAAQVVWLVDRTRIPHRLNSREDLAPQVQIWANHSEN